MNFLDEIRWRGLAHQVTDDPGLEAHLASGTRRAYAGFDPTADSLTIGNLVPIMLLVHFARAGHEPVVVMGGGTGLIGDPSGKEVERQLLTPERVEQNVDRQRAIFESVFKGAGLEPPTIVNNQDWLGPLGFIEVLRDVGKHFSVNMMIQKESVRARLHEREHGISYTEFSYMILQAYDFAHLFAEHGVTIQMGGSDQWGNIVAGADLIRRMETREAASESAPGEPVGSDPLAFGLTAPLVTRSDGGKFGKTETGAVWLTPERTSPYAFYQFWLNAADQDVPRYLRLFTLLTQQEIEELERRHAENPGAREAHRTLALEATALVHGREQAEQAKGAARALFSGEVAGLSEGTLEEVFAGVPSSECAKSDLQGPGADLVELLAEIGLAQSKRQAREFLSAGSVSVNGRRVGLDARLTSADLLHGSMIALRRGKKTWRLTRWR